MLKKSLLFALLFMLLAVPHAAKANLCENIKDATKGIVTCGPEATTSFEGFKGGLQPPSEEGYEASLTQVTEARSFIVQVVNFATGFLGLIATVMLIYGGFLYLTARGEQEQTEKGKKTIGYTVAGIIIILGSFAFVNTVLQAPTGSDTGGGTAQTALVGTAGFLNNQTVETARDLVVAYKNFIELKTELDNLHVMLEQFSLPLQFSDALSAIQETLTSVQSRLNIAIQKHGAEPALIELANLFAAAVNGWKNAYTFIAPGADEKMLREELSQNWKVFRLVLSGDENADQLPALTVGGALRAEFKVIYEEAIKKGKSNIGFEGIIAAAGEIFDDRIDDLKVRLAEMYEPFSAHVVPDIDALFMALASKKNLTLVSTDLILKKFFKETCGVETSLLQCIKDKKNESTAVSAKEVEKAINILGKLPEALKGVKFVETKLTADTLEGSAPLTVNFSTIGSIDPSEKSIQGDQIHWDLDGDDFNTGPGFFKKTTAKPGSCDAENEDFIKTKSHLNSTRTCTYLYPGTYRVGVQVFSADKSIVSGIVFVTVKVQEPASRIRLAAHVLGLSNPVIIKKYSDKGFLEIDKPSFTVTMSQAQAGITFDADGTVSGSVDLKPDPLALANTNETSAHTLATIQTMKWDFGDGTDMVQGSTADVSVVHPKHTYQKTGTYKVTLEVTDISGNTDRKIVNVKVSEIAAFINILPGFSSALAEPITLDGTSSHSDKGTISTFQWKAVAVSDQKPAPELFASTGKYTAKLKSPGTYSLSLKVIDSTGESAEDQVTLNIESEPPVARFDWKPVSSYQPNTILFDAGNSFDPDSPLGSLEYAWTIEEPETDFIMLEGSVSDKKRKIKFLKSGTYHVTLKVSDKNEPGKESKETKLVKIEDMLDAAWSSFDSSAVLQTGQANVNISAASDHAVAYEIDFGDGSAETGGNFSGGFATASHMYEKAGTFTVSLTVFDQENNDKTLSRNLFVAPDNSPIAVIDLLVDNEPAAIQGDTVSVNKKQLITFDASQSLNRDGTPRKLLYQWDFGDGVKSSKKVVTHAYKDLSPQQGYYEVTLTATDKDDPSVTATSDLRVEVVSEPPRLASLTAVVEGQTLTTPVKVTVTAVGAEDPDGKIIQYRFWYYDVTNPDEELGVQVSKVSSTLLTIGTRGEEGEKVAYGFGVELTDNDNHKVSSEDLLFDHEVSEVEVVNGANKLPIAKFSVDRTTLKVGESVSFSSTSKDPDGEVVGYVWDIDGDGFHNDQPSSKPNLTHIYNKVYDKGVTIRLKVIDNASAEAISDPIKIFVMPALDPNLQAVLKSNPPPASDGKIHLSGASGNVTFDFSASKGKIAKYIVDKNILFDTNGNGVKDDDQDFSSAYPVLWTTDFQKAWGKIVVKLTVKDASGAPLSGATDTKEVVFDAPGAFTDSGYTAAFLPNASEATIFLAAFSSLGILTISLWRHRRRKARQKSL